jgi:hypothetical protein
MNKATFRRNWVGLIPLSAALVLTVVGIALNVNDEFQTNPGEPLLTLGGIIAIGTFGAASLVNALRKKDGPA